MDDLNNTAYPWQKTYMFGVDLSFGSTVKAATKTVAAVAPEIREVVKEVVLCLGSVLKRIHKLL